MKTFEKFCAVLALALVATGCGTQFGGNYSGTWVATQQGSQLPQSTFNMTVYQIGTTVSGNWQATGTSAAPVSGTLTGTTNGSTLVATMVIPANATYAGTYTGSLILTNGMLTGNLTGSMTSGGTFSATPTITQTK